MKLEDIFMYPVRLYADLNKNAYNWGRKNREKILSSSDKFNLYLNFFIKVLDCTMLGLFLIIIWIAKIKILSKLLISFLIVDTFIYIIAGLKEVFQK